MKRRYRKLFRSLALLKPSAMATRQQCLLVTMCVTLSHTDICTHLVSTGTQTHTWSLTGRDPYTHTHKHTHSGDNYAVMWVVVMSVVAFVLEMSVPHVWLVCQGHYVLRLNGDSALEPYREQCIYWIVVKVTSLSKHYLYLFTSQWSHTYEKKEIK